MDPFKLIAENRILDAMERGEFENLPGEGRPIDFAELERIPAEYRMAYSVLKNSEFNKPEADLLKTIRALKTEAKTVGDDPKAATLQKIIQIKEAQLLALRNKNNNKS